MKSKLSIIAITIFTVNIVFSENPKPTRVQTAEGNFILTTITVKEKFFVKATALVQNNANQPPLPPPVSTSLDGHWKTTDLAGAAFNQQYNSGPTRVVSAISYQLGTDEVTSGPTNSYYEESERSGPKTQRKISESGRSNPAWTFTSWTGESPPKCEIAGNSPSLTKMVGNITTITTTTSYTWTANWTETQQ